MKIGKKEGERGVGGDIAKGGRTTDCQLIKTRWIGRYIERYRKIERWVDREIRKIERSRYRRDLMFCMP